MSTSAIPDWLYFDCWKAIMAGELYPQIRAIAVRYDAEQAEILLRFYLDREPTDFDLDGAGEIASYISEEPETSKRLKRVTEQCQHSTLLCKDLDPLDGFIYLRREYEMHENPNATPTYLDIQS